MVALMPGITAPDVSLRSLQGGPLSLSSALSSSPVAILIFFKVGCPVCQFIFPYLERLHKAYPNVPLWGVSQDDDAATTNFTRTYGSTFPVLLDERLNFTTHYGLTNVPTVFVVGKNGQLKLTSVGFVKADLEQINEQLATLTGTPLKPLFTESDDVPAVRPG